MNATKSCPNCGKSFPPSSLEGVCPECMLKVGAATESVPETVIVSEGMEGGASELARPMTGPPRIDQDFGNYRIIRRLGHGGMGVVYEAEEKDSGRRVALKVLNQKLGSDQDRARFLREGRLAAAINHPNSVYVFGTDDVEGTPVIAMEFVPGGTLQQRVAQQGPLSVAAAVDTILQIIAGLEAAQDAGILHRDIKPSNCFEEPSGAVKIGDFGLSVSTLPREASQITESGAMVGTPAFCSPEQLRGEELNTRSDIYSVGVTLFYLLTGKTPFEGQTLPQLIANTLEKRPPSPREHRKEIPTGLARAILRCLNKQPSDRFKNYVELRRALEPYASTSPTPATLGLRALAGFVDALLLSAVAQTLLIAMLGSPYAILDRLAKDPWSGAVILLPSLGFVISYYALCEWYWGGTPGKVICRLRVIRADRSYPRLSHSLLRAGMFNILPSLPAYLWAAFNPGAYAGQSAGSYFMGASFYGILGLLFITARRRNGFAALHDLASGTRVVSRLAVASRPTTPPPTFQPGDIEAQPTVGPYHLLESLGAGAEAEWFMGYDLRLLRRVLIRRVSAGTPELPPGVRQLARVGRLRWLSGRRGVEESWDAFEGASGQALLPLIQEAQSWGSVRFWLHDLAEELARAEQDQTVPPVLELDRVWITADGRAKLLDFPAPGTEACTLAKPSDPKLPPSAEVQGAVFLNAVATQSLNGMDPARPPQHAIAARLPLHAWRCLERLATAKDVRSMVSVLRPLLRRSVEVTRLRRAVVVLGCIGFPILASIGFVFGLSVMESWQRESPERMELYNVLNLRRVGKSPVGGGESFPEDRAVGIFVASHYRHLITNEVVWSGALTRTFIPEASRRFAERSLDEYGTPTPEELAEAEAAVRPILEKVNSAFSGEGPLAFQRQPGFPVLMLTVAMLIYVAAPAIIAALCFRGGLVLLATGVTFVRRDGRVASRLRLFWRSLLAWSPCMVALILSALSIEQESWTLAGLGLVLLMGLTVVSLVLPHRGLQDRLAGTWPVAR